MRENGVYQAFIGIGNDTIVLELLEDKAKRELFVTVKASTNSSPIAISANEKEKLKNTFSAHADLLSQYSADLNAYMSNVKLPSDASSFNTDDIEDISKLFGILKSAGIDPVMQLKRSHSIYSSLASKIASQRAVANIPQVNVSVASVEEYRKTSKDRIMQLNRTLDQRWKSLAFDSQNNVQEAIARAMHYGNNVMLLGETGIGKTFNPEEIGRKNNFPVHMIQFNLKTDSVDLHGVDILKPTFSSSEAIVRYKYGLLSKAFLRARDEALRGSPSIIILDELLRTDDMSPLISSLSTFDETKEYALTLPNEIEMIKIQTKNAGSVWMKIDPSINLARQNYKITAGGIGIEEDMQPYLTDSLEIAELMASRGELLTITPEKARLILPSIIETAQISDVIRVPSRAITIVATSNVGENYDVAMQMDNALFRRMKAVPVVTPAPEFMLKKTMEKYIASGDIPSTYDKKIEKIILRFVEGIEALITKAKINTPHRINFSTVEDIVRSIDWYNPEKTGFGGISDVLRDKASHFATIESGIGAEDILKDKTVAMISDAANKILGDSGLIVKAETPATPRTRRP